MSRILIALGLVMVFSSFTSALTYQKAEDMVRACELQVSEGDSTITVFSEINNYGYCKGFFAGMAEDSYLFGNPLICLPQDGVSYNQAIRIFLKYAQAHPEKLHENARFVTSLAFVEAFPCKK